MGKRVGSASESIDALWEIPSDWRWASLNDVGSWGSGGTPKANNASFYGGRIPWVRSGELDKGVIQSTEKTLTELGLNNSSAKWVPPGALLVALYGANIGQTAITGIRCTTNQAVAFCIPNEKADVSYLFRYIGFIKKRLCELGQGGAQPNISQAILRAHPIPLPPTDIQHRTVNRIDGLIANVDNGESELREVRTGLDTYRKSLLNAAVTGELTADWRIENPATETGSDFLKRLSGDRKTDAQRARKTKINSDLDNYDLPELPTTWTWATVGDVGQVVTGATPPTSREEYYGGEVPFFTPSDLDVGYGVVTAARTITAEGAEVVRPIPAFSILVTCIGATIGKVGYNFVSGATNQQINSIVCGDRALSEFLFNYFSSPRGFHSIVDGSSSTTLPIINKGDFARLPIPVPPRKEIEVINHRVSEHRAKYSDLVAELSSLQSLSSQLRQSILASAFRGELSS